MNIMKLSTQTLVILANFLSEVVGLCPSTKFTDDEHIEFMKALRVLLCELKWRNDFDPDMIAVPTNYIHDIDDVLTGIFETLLNERAR